MLDKISVPLQQFAVPLDSLRKDPRNARLHPDRNLHAIRQSLRKFGQQKPIVVDVQGVIIAGNGTLEAAALEGWTHVAAITSGLAGQDATAYGLADNRTAETAEWDYERVSELIKELKAFDYELDALGWQSYELEPLMAAGWTPAPVSPLPESSSTPASPNSSAPDSPQRDEQSSSAPSTGERAELRYVPFTDDQHEVVTLAVGKLRENENASADDIPEGRALELICADWLSGQ